MPAPAACPRRIPTATLPQNLRNQIQDGRTSISIVISPETSAADIAALLETIAPGAGIACTPVRTLLPPRPMGRHGALAVYVSSCDKLPPSKLILYRQDT